MPLAFDNIIIEPIGIFNRRSVKASVLRLDRIHPVVSGNKWFKLQYYLKEAKEKGRKRIVTFGGAYSNHLVAAAAACRMLGFLSAGIIRGERPAQLSATLRDAAAYGMELFFANREEYRERIVPAALQSEENYFIEQGGYGDMGARGAAGIRDHIKGGFTHCCCAVGTGTMMAGLLASAPGGQDIIGISSMKNNTGLEASVQSLAGGVTNRWEIIHDYHFGGFARHKPELLAFMNSFYRQTGVPSDFVYTGKLFFAIDDLISRDFFPRGSRILLIHSGGLQGNISLEKGKLIF